MLELSRFVMGAGLGFSITISTLYIMELTTPNMRAGLAVVPAIAGSLGLLAIQVLGAFILYFCLEMILFCTSLLGYGRSYALEALLLLAGCVERSIFLHVAIHT